MTTAAPATTAAAARHAAEKILSGPPYVAKDDLPRPLAGLLHAIGHALLSVVDPVLRWIGRLFHPVAHSFHTAFGNWWPLPVVALVLVAGVTGALLVMRRRIRRGRPSRPGPAEGASGPRTPTSSTGRPRRPRRPGSTPWPCGSASGPAWPASSSPG